MKRVHEGKAMGMNNEAFECYEVGILFFCHFAISIEDSKMLFR